MTWGEEWNKAVAFSLNSHLSFVPFGFCKYYLFKDNNNNILISKELFRYDLKLNTQLLYIYQIHCGSILVYNSD